MSQPISLQINGAARTVEVDPETPLLYVLRQSLDQRGTRFGCGDGQCGACTVLIDGRIVQSCTTPVSAAGGAIETIEGLTQTDDLHPVVAELIAWQAGQCGYCLPGIAMAAVGLLRQTPRPTRREIATALDGNLCRCGAQTRILDAIEAAADRMAEVAS